MKIYVVAGGDTVYKIAGGNPDLMEELEHMRRFADWPRQRRQRGKEWLVRGRFGRL